MSILLNDHLGIALLLLQQELWPVILLVASGSPRSTHVALYFADGLAPGKRRRMSIIPCRMTQSAAPTSTGAVENAKGFWRERDAQLPVIWLFII